MPVFIKPSEKEFFLKELTETLERLAFEVDFDIHQLCRNMGMSRSSLHRKIRASADRSTSIYIREFRLKKANELLLSTEKSIKKIAFEVGFSDLAYFSKCFKLLYKVSPRKMRRSIAIEVDT